jgi:V/A-type H+-transporting ATPase subunit A
MFSFCYLQQNAFDKEDAYCSLDQQQEQFGLINHIFEMDFNFSSADEAKEFFMVLQNDMRNLNFLPFNTDRYNVLLSTIKDKLEKIEAAAGV